MKEVRLKGDLETRPFYWCILLSRCYEGESYIFVDYLAVAPFA